MTEGVPFPKVEALLIKPRTFVNLSGLAVKAATRSENLPTNSDGQQSTRGFRFRTNAASKNRMDELLVIVDDLFVPFGRIKLKSNNDSQNNGLRHISQVLQTRKCVYLGLRFQRVPCVTSVLDHFF